MRRSLRFRFYLLVLFLLAGFLAYSINLTSYFLSDDFVQIGKVLHGDFSVAWGQEHGGFFRPLFILSYVLDSRLWRANPFGYHVTNIAIHALNSFLIFQLGVRFLHNLSLTDKHKQAIAIGAAALFLFHPSHTEAVTWISGRADLIATCFCLASLLGWVAYTSLGRGRELVFSLAAFALALLAKESAVCLPFLVLITGLGLPQGRGKPTLITLAKVFSMFAAILVIFIGLRAFVLGSVIGGYGSARHLNFSPGWIRDRLLEGSIRSLLPPVPDGWRFFLHKPLKSWPFYVIVLVAAGCIALAIIIRRKVYDQAERRQQNRFLLMLAGLFLIALVPVINLRLNLNSTLGERFLYLPSVFSSLLAAYLFAILIRRPKAYILLLILGLGFFSVSLFRTNLIWRDASLLSKRITHDLALTPIQDRLIIINAPDNLRGVPVFHNGLPEALVYFHNRASINQTQVVSFESLVSTTSALQVIRTGDDVQIIPIDQRETFDRVSGSDCVQVLSQSIQSLTVRLGECTRAGQTFIFDRGRMIRLPDGEP